MKDMQAQLERLRLQITECELIRDLATDPAKRELFASLVKNFELLTNQIEKKLADPLPETFFGRKTQEPFPREDEL
ncbi:MAG TPA: hypothetical protein VI216_02085 [Candidatus Acidoferrales bacterium]|jgi:hypothetical protein